MRALGDPRWALVAALALLIGGGCATADQVGKQSQTLETFMKGFDQAARICAPRELAEARANLEFATYDSGLGRTTRAWGHLRKARRLATWAHDHSQDKKCAPDSDMDGIPDTLDKCPHQPEDYDGDRDTDGCPDVDTDGDGIDDDLDKCPHEAGPKSNHGCPILDSDHDGLPDDVDRCPNQAGPKENHGCPEPDTDGDGVPDMHDKCPNRPGPASNHGCPRVTYKHIVVTRTRIELKQKIYFESGRAVLKPESDEVLDEIVDALRVHKNLNLRIEGYTDSVGRATYNQKLSQRRAKAVRKYLMRKGLDPTRMIAVGYGEEVPIDTNATAAGRARNRRVEFHIIR